LAWQRTRPGEQSLEVELLPDVPVVGVNGQHIGFATWWVVPRDGSWSCWPARKGRLVPAEVNGKKASGVERRHGSGRGKSFEGLELHERSGMK
jgi:hypothetical protein